MMCNRQILWKEKLKCLLLKVHLVFLIIREGTGPRILSIMARCSLLSWVCESKTGLNTGLSKDHCGLAARWTIWRTEQACGHLHNSRNPVAQYHPSTHLEEGEANVVLKDDTAYAPYIARL